MPKLLLQSAEMRLTLPESSSMCIYTLYRRFAYVSSTVSTHKHVFDLGFVVQSAQMY